MSTTTTAKGKAIAKPQAAATNNPAKTETVTYTLSRLGEPDGKFKPSYIAEVEGKNFLVGQFDTAEDAHNAVKTYLPEWLNQLANPKPVYRVEKIGTVTVDVGTIMILDPCRINALAATQKQDDPGYMCDSPLMPVGMGFKMDGSDGKTGKMVENELSKQIIDHPTPDKFDPKNYGTSGGNALSLSTGFGDGEYEVFAEIVDFGGILGERIASIRMQFIADEDIAEAKKLAKKLAKTAAAGE